MEQKLDFIEKEIQKMSFFIQNLLKLGSKINQTNFESEINEIDEKIQQVFNFSFYSLETISNEEFLNELSNLPNEQLDQFLLFLSDLNERAKENGIEFKDLKNKLVALIEHQDKYSTDFSIQRMEIKDRLK